MIQGENSAEFNKVLKDIPNISFLDVVKDAHIRKAFKAFNETQVSTGTYLVVVIFITLVALVFLFRFGAFVMSEHTDSELVGALMLVGITTVLLITLWIIWFLKLYNKNPNRSRVMKFLYRIQPTLQIVLPIGISVFYGLHLILRVSGGQCTDEQMYLARLMCNPNADTDGLPEETLAQLMLMPIVFQIIMRDSFTGTFLVSYIISISSITASGFIVDIRSCLPFLLVYYFTSFVIFYDCQRQNLSLFFLAEKLKYSLSENERLADETHASELRHMIANVAHDLKTPLTSFLSGVEFISQIVMDWDERLGDPNKSLHTAENVEFTAESLNAIHGCLESIRNTNSFMIMTINRCIDFTKASKGLKLVPKLETIDLQETVDLPIKVMRDFKSHLAINMLPISAEICTHVISDRQWLQENLLCLMSNAVKYSSKGTIEICVTLVTLAVIKPESSKKAEAAKPSPRKKKLSKIKVVPTNGGSSGGDGSGTPGTGTPQGGGSASVDRYSPTQRSLSLHNSGNGTPGGGTEHPDSVKMRKLSNFVFNHDYSTMGRSKIFSDKMLADLNREEGEENAILEEEEDEEGETADEDVCHEQGQFLRIEVQDTGIGLSEDVMQTLFSPFRQAQRLAGGTGLGLYSLAKRIEALCGHYGVSNRRDGTPGSLFWFAIPYRPDTVYAHTMLKQNKGRANSMRGVLNHAAHAARVAVMRATNADGQLIDLEKDDPHLGMSRLASNSMSNNSLPSEPSLAASSTSGRPSSAGSGLHISVEVAAKPLTKLSILLVDDSLSILKMTAMMLKRSGHKVEQADNGAEGLDMILRGYEKVGALGTSRSHLRDCPYDVVLMDLQMPIMDGLESVRRLRAAERDLLLFSDELSGLITDTKHAGEITVKGPLNNVVSRTVLSTSTLNDSEKTIASSLSGARAGQCVGRRRQFVIGVSANSDHGTMLEAMKAGFDAFIGKPFSIDAFYEVLQAHQSKEKERKH